MSVVQTIAKRFGFLPATEIKKTELRLLQKFSEAKHDAYTRALHEFRRSYDAGSLDRLSTDWNPVDYTADQHWYQSNLRMKARARDLAMNDGYAANFIRLCRLNIAGAYGFTYQADIRENDGRADELANKIVETGWVDWCLRLNCTVTGLHSFRRVQHMVIEQLKRDGEFLVKKVFNDSKYGFQLQMLEPDLIDDRLNKRLDGGNIIVLGVELNAYRKPVAYWLRGADETRDLFRAGMTAAKSVRVEANLIYHGFDQFRAFQTRGVTAMSPSMRRMRVLHGYEEAYAEKVRSAASVGGFYQREIAPDGTPVGLANQQAVDGEKDERGNLVRTLEPGTNEELPLGYKYVPNDPDFPSDSHGDYMIGSLIGVAAGWGPGYNTIASDLRNVNFSALRNGKGEERELWRDGQEAMIEDFVELVKDDWLRMAMATQAVTLPLSKFEKFRKGSFTGRTWDHFDPLGDIQARILEILFGLATRSRYAAERGDDLNDIYKKLSDEMKLAGKLGLTFQSNLNAQPPVNSDDETPSEKKGRALPMDHFINLVRELKALIPTNGNAHAS